MSLKRKKMALLMNIGPQEPQWVTKWEGVHIFSPTRMSNTTPNPNDLTSSNTTSTLTTIHNDLITGIPYSVINRDSYKKGRFTVRVTYNQNNGSQKTASTAPRKWTYWDNISLTISPATINYYPTEWILDVEPNVNETFNIDVEVPRAVNLSLTIDNLRSVIRGDGFTYKYLSQVAADYTRQFGVGSLALVKYEELE